MNALFHILYRCGRGEASLDRPGLAAGLPPVELVGDERVE
jgi:hypothetical protein